MILTASLAAASMLLVMAGAAKVADPSRTAGALAALGWPSSAVLVRVGAASELLLGATTLVVGGRVLALLVGASYIGFALFVMEALRRRTPIGTCGCFGQEDTPPRSLHVVIDVALAGGSVAAAATNDAVPLVETSWPVWLLASALALVAYSLVTIRSDPTGN